MKTILQVAHYMRGNRYLCRPSILANTRQTGYRSWVKLP